MRLHSGCIHLASGIYKKSCCNQAATHCSSISFFTPILLRAASIAFKKAFNLAALQQQTIGLQPLQQRHYLSKRVWPFYDHAVHVPALTLVDSVKAHVHTYQKPWSYLPNTLAWDCPWPSFELKKKRGVSYFTDTSSSCVHMFYLFLALHVSHLQTYQTCMLLVDYKHFFLAHLLSCLPTTGYIQSSYCHASYLQSSCTNFRKKHLNIIGDSSIKIIVFCCVLLPFWIFFQDFHPRRSSKSMMMPRGSSFASRPCAAHVAPSCPASLAICHADEYTSDDEWVTSQYMTNKFQNETNTAAAMLRSGASLQPHLLALQLCLLQQLCISLLLWPSRQLFFSPLPQLCFSPLLRLCFSPLPQLCFLLQLCFSLSKLF